MLSCSYSSSQASWQNKQGRATCSMSFFIVVVSCTSLIPNVVFNDVINVIKNKLYYFL